MHVEIHVNEPEALGFRVAANSFSFTLTLMGPSSWRGDLYSALGLRDVKQLQELLDIEIKDEGGYYRIRNLRGVQIASTEDAVADAYSTLMSSVDWDFLVDQMLLLLVRNPVGAAAEGENGAATASIWFPLA